MDARKIPAQDLRIETPRTVASWKWKRRRPATGPAVMGERAKTASNRVCSTAVGSQRCSRTTSHLRCCYYPPDDCCRLENTKRHTATRSSRCWCSATTAKATAGCTVGRTAGPETVAKAESRSVPAVAKQTRSNGKSSHMDPFCTKTCLPSRDWCAVDARRAPCTSSTTVAPFNFERAQIVLASHATKYGRSGRVARRRMTFHPVFSR